MNRIVIFPTDGSFLRKLFKVQSSLMCAEVTLHRQGLNLNSSENVPPCPGYITMHSNSFSVLEVKQRMDGRTDRQTDKNVYYACTAFCVRA